MPFWYYFRRPKHLEYHDFTTTIKSPQNIRRLLGLGLKFTPTPRWTQNGNSSLSQDNTLKHFHRDLILKCHFGPDPI
jgi:hypothetical protein